MLAAAVCIFPKGERNERRFHVHGKEGKGKNR